jgi:hypothetical protein
MRLTPLLPWLLVLSAGAEDTPSPTAIRSQIDKLIAAQVAAKKPANLALLRDAIALSISYGGPAYNGGDHEACMTCYRATISSLLAAFPGASGTTPAAATPLHDLDDAAQRAHAFIDVDRQAWTLRFGFDQVTLACSQAANLAQLQVQTGAQYFGRGDYDEAEIAYARGAAEAAEIDGMTLADTPVNARIATILHAQTLLMLGKTALAATEMAKGMVMVPELTSAKFDLHSIYGDQRLADQALGTATTYAAAHAADADALFLVAFEQQFGGKVDEAAKTLASVLKLVPTHAAAVLLTSPELKSPAKTPSETVP